MGSFFVGTTDLKFESLCMLLCVKKVSALLTMNNFSSIGGEMDEDIPHNVGNYELKKRKEKKRNIQRIRKYMFVRQEKQLISNVPCTDNGEPDKRTRVWKTFIKKFPFYKYRGPLTKNLKPDRRTREWNDWQRQNVSRI